jgi:hypothetical protein
MEKAGVSRQLATATPQANPAILDLARLKGGQNCAQNLLEKIHKHTKKSGIMTHNV